MRIAFSIASVVMLLLAVASFITAVINFWPILDYIIPGATSGEVKEAEGVVSDVTTSTSRTTSVRTGNSYSTGSTTVTIRFNDDRGHLFEIMSHPIFKSFKEKDKVRVIYFVNKYDEQNADEFAKKAKETGDQYPTAEMVTGIPKSWFLWLERPIIFIVIGIVLLILRFPVGMIKQTFQ
jgi:hypothetical protein